MCKLAFLKPVATKVGGFWRTMLKQQSLLLMSLVKSCWTRRRHWRRGDCLEWDECLDLEMRIRWRIQLYHLPHRLQHQPFLHPFQVLLLRRLTLLASSQNKSRNLSCPSKGTLNLVHCRRRIHPELHLVLNGNLVASIAIP